MYYICIIRVADKKKCLKFHAMHKFGPSPIGCKDFSIPELIIYTWGIGIESSPIPYEGFVQPRKGQGEAKTKFVFQ